jgi:hypothetical protein
MHLLDPDAARMLTHPVSMLRLSSSRPFGSGSWAAVTVLMAALLLARLDGAQR